MIPSFRKSRYEPKPLETDYWIDLNENEFGGVVKYYDWNRKEWKYPVTVTTEKEPQFVSSPAYNITDDDILNWNSRIDTTELENRFEELAELLKDLIDSIYLPENIVTQDVLDSTVRSIENKLDDKADVNSVYTIDEVDAKIPTVPTKVSAFENDSKYITEANLADKLPENIVSDANYVHTDNNFTTDLKDKLTNLDPDASNYDDTEVRNLIKDNTDSIRELNKLIDSLNSSVSDINSSITDINNSITDVNNSLDTKADKSTVDAMYTNEELDLIFTLFITKTHKSYGFCDERPTDDLTIEDTGFIFYDYTANEPLIWVTNEWRVLRSNQVLSGLNNIVMKEDQYETIGDWEYNTTDDYRYNWLTSYIGNLTDNTDLIIPNIYNGFFAIGVGNVSAPKRKRYKRYPQVSYTNTTYVGITGETFRYTVKSLDDDFAYYSNLTETDKLTEVYPDLIIPNCLERTVATISPNDYSSYDLIYSVDKTTLNSLSFSKGIKNIGNFAFANIRLPNDTNLNLPSGLASIGYSGFRSTEINELKFPVNPINVDSYAFCNCKIKKLALSKNINTDDSEYGEHSYLFSSESTDDSMELTIEDGVKAIPQSCFYNVKISNKLEIPRSVEYIGYSAFYDSNVSMELDATHMRKLDGWCLGRTNRISSFVGGDKLEIICPNALYSYKGSTTVTKFLLPSNIKKIGNNGVSLYLFGTNADLTVPSSLKVIPSSFVNYYGYNFLNEGSAAANVDFSLNLREGIEYISSFAFRSTGFTNELILPESTILIGEYAFAHSTWFSNTVLRIPKNVRYIGGDNATLNHTVYEVMKSMNELYLLDREANANNIYDKTFGNKYLPTSPHGYFKFDIKQYIEDGGVMERAGFSPFYGFATYTLQAFEVDPENEYFDSPNGVLYTKDHKALIAYPPAKEGTRYEMEEGCEYMYDLAFGRCGCVPTKEITTNDGTTISYTWNGNPHFSHPNGIHTLVLADSFVLMDGEQFTEKYPQHAIQYAVGNLGYGACYYNGVLNFEVKETNPRYACLDGCLYDKDFTTLLYIPEQHSGDVNIPDTVTTIKPFMQVLAKVNEKILLPYTTVSPNNSTYQHSAGLHIHIPASVIDIDPFAMYQLSVINLGSAIHCSVDIDENNPRYTINPGNKYIVEK